MFSVIFPGQGSQSVGMAENLYNEYPYIKTLFDKADEILGISLSNIILKGPKDKLDQTENEIKNHLEQLRALDNNIKINVALAKSSPIGVDTKEDYLALKKIMEYKS